LYNIAEAAKAMGLEESVILKAIEDGQITGTKNVSGEWQVDDVELNLLYLLLARDFCKRQWQADARTNDGRSQEPEIANIADDYEALLETPTGADRAEAGPSLSGTSTWQDDIRMDDRDRISASHSRPVVKLKRTRLITATLLLALGCIGALTSFYLLGRFHFPEQNANSSGPVLGSDQASIPAAALERRSREEIISSGEERISNVASATQNLTQPRTSSAAVTEHSSAIAQTAPKKGEARTVRKLVPYPETKPSTIPGWTVRNVVNGIATLEGPAGTWQAARGDTVPGVGTVNSVVLWGNRWIVATSKGLISTP
jgi:hypothetical protein